MIGRLTLALVASVALGLTACAQEEVDVVDRALREEVRSGRADVRLRVTEGRRTALAVRLAGPFRSNGRLALPSFDWRVRLRAAGERPFAARVISTGRNVFVRYRGRTYEAGERRSPSSPVPCARPSSRRTWATSRTSRTSSASGSTCGAGSPRRR